MEMEEIPSTYYTGTWGQEGGSGRQMTSGKS